MQIQFNLNKKVVQALFGPGLIALALFLAMCVPDDHPHFAQILLGFLCIAFGIGGVMIVLVTAIEYFSEKDPHL